MFNCSDMNELYNDVTVDISSNCICDSECHTHVMCSINIHSDIKWLNLARINYYYIIEDSVSVDQELDFGVSQGSVLGPRIYCMYTKPVSDIIQRHGLSHHSYANDTQLYMTMDHSNNDWRDGLARVELCVSEIRGG